MTEGPRLLTPIQESRGHGRGRLAVIMRAAVPANVDALVHRSDVALPGWEIATLDVASDLQLGASESTAIVHMLWTQSERGTGIVTGLGGSGDDDPPSFTMHPGDTMVIPAGMPWSIGGRAIVQVVRSEPSGASALDGPSHGLSVFERFNRRTLCAVTQELALDRWKLTAPQSFTFEPRGWHLFCNLVTPTSLVWAKGIMHLDRLAVCLVPPEVTTVTVVPDGLGYVTHAYVPDLTRDVLEPFRQAGFDRAALTRVPGLRDLL